MVRLAGRILEAKAADASADTGAEEEIDRLVYGLYGLTGEEVREILGMEGG